MRTRKEGLYVYYICREGVIKLLAALREAVQHTVVEVARLVETYLKTKDSLEPVSANEPLERMHQGLGTIVDVRTREEYAAGHLPGAINLPPAEIDSGSAALPRDRDIVAYCRGPFCVLSFEAVSQLAREGFQCAAARNRFSGMEGFGSAGRLVHFGEADRAKPGFASNVIRFRDGR